MPLTSLREFHVSPSCSAIALSFVSVYLYSVYGYEQASKCITLWHQADAAIRFDPPLSSSLEKTYDKVIENMVIVSHT